MFNKICKIFRKIHRYLTPVFVIITVLYMFVLQVPILNLIQRVLMLSMAVSGTFLFIQIYYNKYKVNKRKKATK